MAMTKRKYFIYELPYSVRKHLCVILDGTDKWEELGGEHMHFDYTYLQSIRRKESSPTDNLLTEWGNQNHSVDDLFVLLSKMQHYRAMSLLKGFVNEKLHHLLRDGEELMSNTTNNNLLNPRTSNTVKGTVNNQTRAGTAASDNKDMGLNMQNINLNEENTGNKPCSKSVDETKIQNGPNAHLKQTGVEQNQRQLGNMEIKLSEASAIEVSLPLIEYRDLRVATNDWNPGCILGQGGFGTVYKGTWKHTIVAIKRIQVQKDHQVNTSESNSNQMEPSMRELKYLSSHRHDNILSLYGYSITENFTCLVYQYMANGSLEDCLHCKTKTKCIKLDWNQRLNIMTGTARGIQFLHSLGEPPLVHGDIKSANILLDSNFEPRLGDFGLAREGPMQQYTHVKVSKVHGTRPYLPDEFLRGKKFSVKVDTYSFGVVLFEVATGLRAYDDKRKEKYLKDYIVEYGGEVNELLGQSGAAYCAASGLLALGKNCVKVKPQERPDMASVLSDMEVLYHSYREAERAIGDARRHMLTPTNPLQMQLDHDENRNPSMRRATPTPVLAQEVVRMKDTGLPHQLLPSLVLQPATPTHSTSTNQASVVLGDDYIPQVTLLLEGKTQSAACNKNIASDKQTTLTDNTTNTQSDFDVSIPNNSMNSNFPLIDALLSKN